MALWPTVTWPNFPPLALVRVTAPEFVTRMLATASPVPVRVNTSDGVPSALLLIVIVAVRTPAAFGEKLTRNVVLPPAGTVVTAGGVT